MGQILLYSSGIIAEKKPTGGELRFLELAGYMAKQKNTELCCADEATALAELGLKADIRMKGSEGTPPFLPEEARILLANRKTLKEIVKSKYDSIIVFDVPPAVGLTLAGAKNLVLMIRKDLIGYEKVKSAGNGLKKKLRIAYQWMCESLCLRSAKQVICQCAYDRDVILSRHPTMAKQGAAKFDIQINNINPSWVVRRNEAADPENKDARKFRICFIGGFDDLRKGQNLFLEAAQLLESRHPELEFVLVGGGRRLQNYRDQFESDRIRFRGRMDNPLSVLKSSDLLVVPSLADSCPNTVMEALYTGIPVIGSRAGGIPEILMDEEALFDPQPGSIAERIERLLTDHSAYERLRESQKQRAKELVFDWPERIMQLIRRN